MSIALIDQQNDLWKLAASDLYFKTSWGWVKHKYDLISELFGPLEAFGGPDAKKYLGEP